MARIGLDGPWIVALISLLMLGVVSGCGKRSPSPSPALSSAAQDVDSDAAETDELREKRKEQFRKFRNFISGTSSGGPVSSRLPPVADRDFHIAAITLTAHSRIPAQWRVEIGTPADPDDEKFRDPREGLRWAHTMLIIRSQGPWLDEEEMRRRAYTVGSYRKSSYRNGGFRLPQHFDLEFTFYRVPTKASIDMQSDILTIGRHEVFLAMGNIVLLYMDRDGNFEVAGQVHFSETPFMPDTVEGFYDWFDAFFEAHPDVALFCGFAINADDDQQH